MRLLATLPEDQARTLADHLLTRQIPAEVRRTATGEGALWVQREEQVEAARRELEEFRRAPDDPRYQGVAGKARALRKEAERVERQHIRNTIPLRDRWAHRPPERCVLTMALMAICVVVFVVMQSTPGRASGLLRYLYIATPMTVQEVDPETGQPYGPPMVASAGLEEVKHGQVWRLITPIFLHFGLMHIAFNMIAFLDIGGLIEMRKGTLRLALLILGSAVVSNLAQFAYDGYTSPYFGGMSGVIYALFGYVWMKGRHEPAGGLFLSQRTVTYMLFWLVFCMTGAVGMIANAAHVAGLVFGVLVGLLPHWRDELRRW